MASSDRPDVASGPDAPIVPGSLGPRTPGEDNPDVAGTAPPPDRMNRDHPNEAAGRRTLPGAGLVTPDGVRTGVGRPDAGRPTPASRPGGTADRDISDAGDVDAGVDANADDRGPDAGTSNGSAGAAARVTSDPNFPSDAARLKAPQQQRSEPAAGQNEMAAGPG
jgi:hypothetical protein